MKLSLTDLIAQQATENDAFLEHRANVYAEIGINQDNIRKQYPDGVPAEVEDRLKKELDETVKNLKVQEAKMYEKHKADRDFVENTEKLNKLNAQIQGEEESQEQPAVEQTEKDTPTQDPPTENALVEEEEIEKEEHIEQEETETERKKREYLDNIRMIKERNKDKGLER
jgi:hypothetical protein